MRELIVKWRVVLDEYRLHHTYAEDICDIVSAFSFTVAAVLYGVAVFHMFGVFHG